MLFDHHTNSVDFYSCSLSLGSFRFLAKAKTQKTILLHFLTFLPLHSYVRKTKKGLQNSFVKRLTPHYLKNNTLDEACRNYTSICRFFFQIPRRFVLSLLRAVCKTVISAHTLQNKCLNPCSGQFKCSHLTPLEGKNSVSPGLRAHFQAQITSSESIRAAFAYLKASVLFPSTAEFHTVFHRNVIYPSEAMNWNTSLHYNTITPCLLFLHHL